MNRTVNRAKAVHGQDPQHLVEKIVRERIYDCLYWKEECFGLNAATFIEKAVHCQYIGGLYGNQRPCPFLCLTLKLLQLQPDKEVILTYINNEEFKYLRALGAFYCRLVFSSKEVYEILEPLLSDYRKLRERAQGGFILSHMDEFIDQLLTQDRVCDIILPRLTQRHVLEQYEGLSKRISPLEKELFHPEIEDTNAKEPKVNNTKNDYSSSSSDETDDIEREPDDKHELNDNHTIINKDSNR